MVRKLAVMVSVVTLSGCAMLEGPDLSNLAAYCTPENAFRLGTESKAYFGGCPKESEAAFLAGLERGRALWNVPFQAWAYYNQMTQLEKQLVASSDEAERERLRARLREAEWWANQIINNPGEYSNFN